MSEERPVMAEHIEIHEEDDGAIVYDAERDRVHHLNPSAAVILALCDGSRTTDEICTAVQETFGLSQLPVEETARGLEALRREALIH